MRDLYKSPTWTLQLLGFKDTLNIPDLRVRRPTFCKRPFLMSWRWCLREALPYAHQTNMSWKHSPTHGLTVFKGKGKKKLWNKQRKSWKNANEKHCVRAQRTLHRLTPSITSYIHTKTTIDFFSTTDYADGTDYIKADLHFLFLNTNHSNVTNLFFALRAEINWKSFWESQALWARNISEPTGSKDCPNDFPWFLLHRSIEKA